MQSIHFESGSRLKVFEAKTFIGSELRNIIIPASITELKRKCFKWANKLVSVSFESNPNLVCIGKSCFEQCNNLESFEFEACTNLRYIDIGAFVKTKISKAVLYPSVCFVSATAFESNSEIGVVESACFENEELSAWTKNRVGDFVKQKQHDFYLGEDFTKTKIGDGSYGDVYLVENRFTGEKFAMKQMKNASTKGAEFEREVEIMKLLKHPCVVSLVGFSSAPPMSLCMEFASEGTLEDALTSSPSWFDATCKLKSIIGVVVGMTFIHGKEIIHRDLKPSNILIDHEHHVKISDFGTARFDSTSVTMNVGTRLYMAPEMRNGTGDINRKVDVFSFGLLLYQLVESVSVEELKGRIGNLEFGEKTQPEVRTLIEQCLSECPEDRPEFADIIESIDKMNFELVEGADTEQAYEYFESISSYAE